MEKVHRLNAIIEILRGSSGRLQKIFIQKEKGPPKIGEVIRLAKARGIPFVFVPRPGLDELAPGHQGAVAVLSAKAFATLEDLLSRGDPPFLVLLDEVEDPQNLGAIIRTAEGAGAGVLIPRHRAAEVTGAVVKASAGATEHAAVARVRNLADSLKEAKKAGFWIYGATAAAESLYAGKTAWPR